MNNRWFVAGVLLIAFYDIGYAYDAEALFQDKIETEIALQNKDYETAINAYLRQAQFYPSSHYETRHLYGTIGGIYGRYLQDYATATRYYEKGENWVGIYDLIRDKKISAEQIKEQIPDICEKIASTSSHREIPFTGPANWYQYGGLFQALGCYEKAAEAFGKIYDAKPDQLETLARARLNKFYAMYPDMACQMTHETRLDMGCRMSSAPPPQEYEEILLALLKNNPSDEALKSFQRVIGAFVASCEQLAPQRTRILLPDFVKNFEKVCEAHPDDPWLLAGAWWVKEWLESAELRANSEEILPALMPVIRKHTTRAFEKNILQNRDSHGNWFCRGDCVLTAAEYLSKIPPENLDQLKDVLRETKREICQRRPSDMANPAFMMAWLWGCDNNKDPRGASDCSVSENFFYLEKFFGGQQEYPMIHDISGMESLQLTPQTRDDAIKLGKQKLRELRALTSQDYESYRSLVIYSTPIQFYAKQLINRYIATQVLRRMFSDFAEPRQRDRVFELMRRYTLGLLVDEKLFLETLAWIETNFPEFPMDSPYRSAAGYYRQQGRYEEAIQYYLKSLAVPSSTPAVSAQYDAGNLYAYLGKWEEAAHYWDLAAKNPCPSDMYHHIQQAAVQRLFDYYRKIGDYENAFDSAAPLRLDTMDCLGGLGGRRILRNIELFEFWMHFGESEQVFSLLERYLEIIPPNIAYQVPLTVGAIYRNSDTLHRLESMIERNKTEEAQTSYRYRGEYEVFFFPALKSYLALVERYRTASLKQVADDLRKITDELASEERTRSPEKTFEAEFLYRELRRFPANARFAHFKKALLVAQPAVPLCYVRALAETELPEAFQYLADKAVEIKKSAFVTAFQHAPIFSARTYLESIVQKISGTDRASQDVRNAAQHQLSRMWSR